MNKGEHHYAARLLWDGNRGDGTGSYTSYGRQYRVLIDGKPTIEGTADAAFRGDAEKLNPEDLFLASLSACHMLTYLALCAKHGIRVLEYEDAATGTMQEDGRGGGRFVEIVLHPAVTVAEGSDVDRAMKLHARAHDLCFIANSCSVPITHRPSMRVMGH